MGNNIRRKNFGANMDILLLLLMVTPDVQTRPIVNQATDKAADSPKVVTEYDQVDELRHQFGLLNWENC